MTTAHELARKAAALRDENAKLQRLIELQRENAKLVKAAADRAKAARQRATLNSRTLYDKRNSKS